MYDRLLEDLRLGREDSPVLIHHVAYLASKSKTIDPATYLGTDPRSDRPSTTHGVP